MTETRDEWSAIQTKTQLLADIALMNAIKTSLGAETTAEALAKLLRMNRESGCVMIRWDGQVVSIGPVGLYAPAPPQGGEDER